MKRLIRPIQPPAIALVLLAANALLAVATPGTTPQGVVQSSQTEKAIKKPGVGFTIVMANSSPIAKLAVDDHGE